MTEDELQARVVRIGQDMCQALEASAAFSPETRVVMLFEFGDAGGMATYGFTPDQDDEIIDIMIAMVRRKLQQHGRDLHIMKAEDVYKPGKN